MISKEDFKPFVQAVWDSLQAGVESSDPSIQLGVRAYRQFIGEESIPQLVADPATVIEQLRSAKTPLANSSIWDPAANGGMGAWKPKSLGSMAADQIARMAEHWKHNPMPPKPPDPVVEVAPPPTKIEVFKCCNCGRPAEEDTRFMEGTNLGTCCGEQFVRKPK